MLQLEIPNQGVRSFSPIPEGDKSQSSNRHIASLESSLEAGIESPRSGSQSSSFRRKSVVTYIAHRLMFSAKASHAVEAASTGSIERVPSSIGSPTSRAGSVSQVDSSRSFFKPTGWALTGQNQAETLDKFFVDTPGQNDSDLMGDSPKSKATESLGLFSTPDEASVDF